MTPEAAKTLFERWYVAPLKKVEELPNGDGGLVAVSVSCYLYERYAVAVLDARGVKADREAVVQQLAADFSVNSATAEAFWEMVRHGFLHQGMPLAPRDGRGAAAPPKYSGWLTEHQFPAMALDTTIQPPLLKFQPWKFRDRVLGLWLARPDLLIANASFPWASIYRVRGQTAPSPRGTTER